MTGQQARERLGRVPGWTLAEDGKAIHREYKMKDFMAAVEMVNRIARLAQEQDHHPDIHLTGYRNLRIELSTHDAGGLSEKDFIQAARINALSVISATNETF